MRLQDGLFVWFGSAPSPITKAAAQYLSRDGSDKMQTFCYMSSYCYCHSTIVHTY